MEPTFEKLLVRLANGGVQFVIVGGIAVTLHGYVRLTEDVDVLNDLKSRSVREKDQFDVIALKRLALDPRSFD
jgi:hypothetical protein